MGKLLQYVIKERKVTILLSIILLVYGLYSYYIIPKQENPEVTSPAGMITTVFPGASATDVEKLVSKRIENEVATIDGVEKIESISNNSASIVIVTLNYEVDKDKQWDILRNKLDAVVSELPDGCWAPELDTDLMNTAGMIITLSGENYTYEQLASFAEDFRNELGKIDGVKRFELDGKLEKEVIVKIDIAKLNQYSLSVENIYDLLKAQNLSIPSGAIQTEKGKINVSAPGTFSSIKDIENLIITISSDTGGIVRLRDIANVYMDLESGSNKFKQDGRNAVLLTGYFEPNKNVVLIGNDVREQLDLLKTKFPSDVYIDEVLFQPEDVSQSVNDFVINLMQGVIFVIIVVFLGMGLRNAIIVSTTIPLTIFITFVIMGSMGIEVQQISIAGLIIALGILVDNSIVVSDAIQVYINEGMDKVKAAFEGTKEVAVPVFTSTLTTLAAFATLLALPGEAGQFAMSLPQVVMISLSVSYVVSMLVTPALASIFFQPSKPKKVRRNYLREMFDKMLVFGLSYKKTTVAIAFGALIVSLLLVLTLTIEMFPYADKDVMYLNVKSEVSGDISKTEELVMQVEDLLKNEPEVHTYTTAIGGSLPKFYLTMIPSAPSPDFAQILFKFDLSKGDRRFKDKQDFALYLQEKFERELVGGTVSVNMLAITMPGPDINIRISGEDRDRVNEVAMNIKSKLEDKSGTLNVQDDISRMQYEYVVNIDTDLATNMGLTRYDIQRQINIALYGAEASVFRKSGNEYNIVVKSDIDSKSELENLAIKSRVTEGKILLKSVATIELGKVLNTIKRYDRQASVSITSDVKPGYSVSDIQSYIEEEIKHINTSGVNITFGGEKELIVKYFKGIGVAAVGAIAMIYIILLIQFNSLLQPIIILVTVPLSLIGSILGLVITRTPLTFTVALGFASLIGIVVNNAILLIEYINQARQLGFSVHDACKDSVDKRFRPIILSTTTTLVGLIPLAMSGSSFFVPMAIGLMFGLMVATVLTMVIVPTIYSMITKE